MENLHPSYDRKYFARCLIGYSYMDCGVQLHIQEDCRKSDLLEHWRADILKGTCNRVQKDEMQNISWALIHPIATASSNSTANRLLPFEERPGL